MYLHKAATAAISEPTYSLFRFYRKNDVHGRVFYARVF